MKHCMLDLETLGTRPGCIVLSIGAVMWDNTGVGEGFYCVLSVEDQEKYDLVCSHDTMRWWEKQTPEARKVLDDAQNLATSRVLSIGLQEFSDWWTMQGAQCIWGNGADFDQPILAALYDAANMPLPWKFFNSRCYRTLKGLISVPAPERKGTHHNALDDAMYQAMHAVAMFKALRGEDVSVGDAIAAIRKGRQT